MKFFSILPCLVAALFVSFAAKVDAAPIGPSDMRGLRDFTKTGGSAFLLGFSAVKSSTEDRTILHFSIFGLGSFTSATLKLFALNSDSAEPTPSTLDVYSFSGDGTVSVDEWSDGSLFSEVSGIVGQYPLIELDITGLLNTAISAGDSYLSFNLRNKDGDFGRYFLSDTIGGVTNTSNVLGPTVIELTTVPVVPLPAGGVLLITALGALMVRRGHTS